jgi:U3 small nucleolar RNA-associated protein 4
MDVHRCRFVPYPSSTINALAFSHPSPTKDTEKAPTNLRLAIGRANGNIEIWNPQRGRWAQEIILRGGKDRSIEALVWTHDLDTNDQDGNTIPGKLRLFSVGYSTVVTEWDLALGKPVRHSGGNYGEIWCMAVQPRWQPPKKPDTVINEAERLEQHIVVGCADGTLVLHSTADEDLRFLRTLARPSGKKSRVLSVSFLGRDRVVAGYADSTIRVYDARNGRQIRSMSLGVGVPGRPSEILVWCMKGLPDGGIVSGDSTGEIKFWDGKTFTLLQKIKSHKADVLTLAVSMNGSNVFSGGMDRRTVMYKKGGGLEKESVKRWAEVSHQRLHVHDVKVMATFESRDMSVVASGGVDTTPIILPLKGFGREHHLSLPTFPNSAPVQSAPRQRLIMSWWDREVQIWRIEPRWLGLDDTQDEPAPTPSRNLVARIMVKVCLVFLYFRI